MAEYVIRPVSLIGRLHVLDRGIVRSGDRPKFDGCDLLDRDQTLSRQSATRTPMPRRASPREVQEDNLAVRHGHTRRDAPVLNDRPPGRVT